MRKDHATAETTAYDRIFSTMKAVEAIMASKGIIDQSKVTAVVMLVDAYRKDSNVNGAGTQTHARADFMSSLSTVSYGTQRRPLGKQERVEKEKSCPSGTRSTQRGCRTRFGTDCSDDRGGILGGGSAREKEQ
ncbi:unnamed protein product [Ascophyllum nodosum]